VLTAFDAALFSSSRRTESSQRGWSIPKPYSEDKTMNTPMHRRRDAIILIVVLSMLSLFSVLIASYVIFSSQVAGIADVLQIDELPITDSLDGAVSQLISGSSDHQSVAFGNSFLEDLYGPDTLVLRVGNQRLGSSGMARSMPTLFNGLDGRGMLFNLPGKKQFFKVPTSLADWHDDVAADLRAELTSLPTNLPQNVDDAIAGRLITFLEGPLTNETFQIIRSFGGANGTGSSNAIETFLAGSIIIDLGEGPSEIMIDGVPEDLMTVAASDTQRLLYAVGDDQQPGRSGVDDDGNGIIDDTSELGFRGSDDLGYKFVLNGVRFNGAGQNPSATTGLYRNGNAVDRGADIELQLNPRLMGSDAHSMASGVRVYPQQDEPWDAPDFENIFLAWQPSDHRSAGLTLPNYTAEELEKLGSQVIPSFHRPAIINYLMNQPIRLLDGSTDGDTFWDLRSRTSPQANDVQQLQALVTRLRRATLRPLRFSHNFFNTPDLDGDGLPFDGNIDFSDGNEPSFVQPLDSNLPFNTYTQRLERLARWLANGPWDVDNDFDGIPDSIWVDFKLPIHTTPDFDNLRPMIAVLVEDLDGKVNINHAGNYRQTVTNIFAASNPTVLSAPRATPTATFDSGYLSALDSLDIYGRGGGVGPAELNFSHLFDFNNPLAGPPNGPSFYTQTSPRRSIAGAGSSVLLTRYGNVLNTRYGGTPLDYTPPITFTAADIHLPGIGDWSQPASSDDVLGRIPYPARAANHSINTAMGRPMDLSGVSRMRRDRFGNEVFDNLDATSMANGLNEYVNQPYENGLSGDTLFTAGELVNLIDTGANDNSLRQLLEDETTRNAMLKSLITSDSQMIDVPEMTGTSGIIGWFAERVTVAANIKQEHLDRMLAPELRKGGKLNLNRVLGNGFDQPAPTPPLPQVGILGIVDEPAETMPVPATSPVVARQASEAAFPQIAGSFPIEAAVEANYVPLAVSTDDFNGSDVNGDSINDIVASPQELLARHLYCLVYLMVADTGAGAERFPNFPYPDGFTNDANIRNRYAARRIAQWAANAVDFRDTNAVCTRLRYDLNPLDGFDLAEAANHTVWGMERPEIEISETFAYHDKRLRRNLYTEGGATTNTDGENANDVSTTGTPDKDMDQFRIPEAGTFVELRSLRSPVVASDAQPSLPRELYSNLNQLELGKTVGIGTQESPVWRLAVGEPVNQDAAKSIRWLYDARRLGQKLAKDQNNVSQINYLSSGAAANWTNDADIDDAITNWQEAHQAAAEVRPSLAAAGEFVTISDDDFDPTNDSASGSRISLERFVWFTDLVPDPSLNVISNVRGGMNLDNVFFNGPDAVDASDINRPRNVAASLSPGQYAVVAPRVSTIFGQTTLSNQSNNYEYNPSNQRLEFVAQNPRALGFRLNYHGPTVGEPARTPRYAEDGTTSGTVTTDYHVNSILPIIAQSLYPGTTQWNTYLNDVDNDEEVGIGFNISAPLAGANYYPAPMYNINSGAATPYPLVDGYRDYDAGIGDHFDEPLDHRATAPLEQRGWSAVGTYQEAVGIFLQRLADPTSPWHPVDNPYLTVDLAPVDLTTLNGEQNAGEQIDPRNDGNLITVDDKSTFDPVTNQFTPAVRFDSRRKIPDTARDRASTVMVLVASDDSDLGNYERQIYTERSALSASFSLLRDTGVVGGNAVWNYQLGSMWTPTNTPDDATIDSSYSINAGWFPYHPRMDLDGQRYRQSLGFVNREYGQPNNPDATGFGIIRNTSVVTNRGAPIGTIYKMPNWADREFQSPIDLVHVPATSQTGLLTQFSPGTTLSTDGLEETDSHFEHLLGFERNLGRSTSLPGETVALNLPLVTPTEEVIVGERSPFELVLDVVSTGEPSYTDNRWFEADTVKFESPAGTYTAPERMFNRVVEFLQPPFNNVPSFRKPGRVNLNTTPDYIRKGPLFAGNANEFLDANEGTNNAAIGSNVINFAVPDFSQSTLTSGFANSQLMANGSVYRSFGWAMSSYYDLDTTRDRPTVLGEEDNYVKSVDTPYGHGLKAFLESRRGYDDTTSRGTTLSLLNPNLSMHYPTQFAGVFSTPLAAQRVPSVQRFLALKQSGSNQAARRRTQDMTVLRSNPDADDRLNGGNALVKLNVEEVDPSYSLPTGMTLSSPPEVASLSMSRERYGLFERPISDLHRNFGHRARESEARFENASRVKNVTTHHSNVFLVRMTVGFFHVDPLTGELGAEYVNRETNTKTRGNATYVVDRSVPVGFLPGRTLNHDKTILSRVLGQ
jgi:hypothetical protein